MDIKSLSSKTSFMMSSGSRIAPPTVFRMSFTTSSLFGTYDGGFSLKYLVKASSPNQRMVLLPKRMKLAAYCFKNINSFEEINPLYYNPSN